MKKFAWLIRSIIYALVFEVLCFIPMYAEITNDEKYIFWIFLQLIIVFIVSACAFGFVKGDTNHPFLYDVPIIGIHLIVMPLRDALLCYINRNTIAILDSLSIFILEAMVTGCLVIILVLDIVFTLIWTLHFKKRPNRFS